MDESESQNAADGAVAVLFRPAVVPLVDAFRSLEILSARYDVHVLDQPEQDLARFIARDAARAIVSDAMLLGFALGRQSAEPLSYRPLKSRQGSLDEYCILTLIAASRDSDSELAFEAAAALRILSFDFTLSLARDLLRQIDMGGLLLERPGVAEFRAVVGDDLFFDRFTSPLGDISEFRFKE
jgi:hypothetical protein